MSGVRWRCPWCPLTFPTYQQSRPEGHECEFPPLQPMLSLFDTIGSIAEAMRRPSYLERLNSLSILQDGTVVFPDGSVAGP